MARRGVSHRMRRLRATVLGLQCKTTVLVVGLLMTVALLFCGLALPQAWRLTTRLDSERAAREAALIAGVSGELIAGGRTEGLREFIKVQVTGHPLWFVQVTDATGKVIAFANRVADLSERSSWGGERGPIGVPVARTLPNGGHYFDVTHPIRRAGRHGVADGGSGSPLLGHVRLGFNRDPTIAEFDAAADLVIGIGIAIVLGSIPLGFLVVRRIIVPMEEMSQVARRFSDGDLAARCVIRRKDEVGALADNLNKMADQVSRKQKEIVTLNEDLEQRVMERTSQLRELASREPLTGLYNRRHISEVLAQRFSEARRYGSDLSVMMIDMDDFKSVNDAFGHQEGDELLILTALTISSQLRNADVAARYGGDEFIVLLPQTHAVDARTLGDRIVEQFEREVREKLPRAEVSLSIGIASLVDSGVSRDEELVREADRAMYQAKTGGKNRIAMASAAVQ